MGDNQLTDRAFWLNYWEGHKNLVFEVSANYHFLPQLESLIKTRKINSLLEIGGFPGYYSVWAPKLGVKTTLLDFVVHRPILHELEKANGIMAGTTGVIEGDLFKLNPESQYDLVMSNGLIEHFYDIDDILRRHTAFIRPGGVLFVSLPNFRGLNGWFQKTFDPSNYSKHNIDCMDIEYLRSQCKNAGLTNIEVQYSGYFSLWLRKFKGRPFWLPLFMKLTWVPIKIFFKLFPFNTKAFSPFIVIVASKSSDHK